ncbi:uncharacterized protein LOC125231302 [Leguminivora glycinivorella]|uniref:uncharacterized protein LOC125231302 n=1 Tax=Leguminivora glycinivorella TaxID=1035111 RepID=UPI00200BB9FB|nr:uncharacterized protein LOC125231302 [Leguminivora glycinivorella]
MSSPTKATCPYCPGSPKLYVVPRGLHVHITKMHRDVANPDPGASPSTPNSNLALPQPVPTITVTPTAPGHSLEVLPSLKSSVRVLRHIPKGARSLAAGKLCDVINEALRTNETEDWLALLSFSFSALRVPESRSNKSLTSLVKENIENSELFLPDGCVGHKSSSKYRAIEAKVYDGDLRGAVRLLMSESSLAPINEDTLGAMREKHPSPSKPPSFPPEPDRHSVHLSVASAEVAKALGSFHNGSASGLDGLSPQHLKELTSSSAGSNGPRLLESLTCLCNFLLKGMLNLQVTPYLYGASLCALSKKDGGIRPIAVGSVIRRLTAKLGCQAVRDVMSQYLQPHQIGFGTTRGCEAAIHATRTFVLERDNTDSVLVKVDLRNAFNCLNRDVMLQQVLERVPSLYPFLYQCYSASSNLYLKDELISSQVGAQQGDPLGPLIFCLAIQQTIVKLKSPLNAWYLDDGTIGGKPGEVMEDLQLLIPALKNVGLEVNPTKCELFTCGPVSKFHLDNLESLLPGIKMVDKTGLSLLGAPIFLEGVSAALRMKKDALVNVRDHLLNLSSHVALTLLRNCFATPRMTYILRTSPTWKFVNEAKEIDRELRVTLEMVLNVELSNTQWVQAALPIRYGGLGIRAVEGLGLVAFLASAHGAADLVARIYPEYGGNFPVSYVSDALAQWSDTIPCGKRPDNPVIQKQWDDILSKRVYDSLVGGASGVDLARLKALERAESGAWLHALPSPQLGTLLDNDSLRISAALRLGARVCAAHRCRCGVMVEEDGHHGLSCQRCAGRFPRHHSINEIVRRALVSANVPCVLEPPGLSRTDGKRPDGLTLVPWRRGRCLVWDATCVSTYAASHLRQTTSCAGSAAESAAKSKHTKYSALETAYDFVPVAIETAGPWGSEAHSFFRELGRRLRERAAILVLGRIWSNRSPLQFSGEMRRV